MKSEDAISTAVAVDRWILESRLRDISLLAQTDRSERVGALATVISKLRSGAYLLGCGPYCCGVLPLTVDEVVLGRPPSPLEALPETVVDFTLNDAVWMIPREASRVHATILRQNNSGKTTYSIRDENSRTGTFVNGKRVSAANEPEGRAAQVQLASGDVISLGPSGVNTYVFLEVA
jgi:hypothetical protein